MTLCDAGPHFALIDPRQGELHERCTRALPSLPSPLVTTWPSFTEAMVKGTSSFDVVPD